MKKKHLNSILVLIALFFGSCHREEDSENVLYIVNQTNTTIDVTFKMKDVELDEFTKKFRISPEDSTAAFVLVGYQGRPPYGYDSAIVQYGDNRFVDTNDEDSLSLLNIASYSPISQIKAGKSTKNAFRFSIDEAYINAHTPR